MNAGDRLPQVTFRTRIRDASQPGPNPFRWQEVTTQECFGGKRTILFAVAGFFLFRTLQRKRRAQEAALSDQDQDRVRKLLNDENDLKARDDDYDHDKYGNRHEFEPEFRGPVKDRGCTDILCLLLFMQLLNS